MAEPPERKHPRLKNYDYAQTGVYFVTFCTKDRKNILSTVGRGALAPPQSEKGLSQNDKCRAGCPHPAAQQKGSVPERQNVGRGALTPPHSEKGLSQNDIM